MTSPTSSTSSLEAHAEKHFTDTRCDAFLRADKAFKQYLLDNEPVYAALHAVRLKGWDNTEGGDEYFKIRRESADRAQSLQHQRAHLSMMKNIGHDMQEKTGAFTPASVGEGETTKVLDLCMAPGGFTSVALETNHDAAVDAISLPVRDGGPKILLPFGVKDSRVRVCFADLTMFASEFGLEEAEVPADHPDFDLFNYSRPFEGNQYDLVICDGQVLRTHVRGEHRNKREATRLTNSELILGLQRIKPGGTFVILLHKIESLDCVLLLREFGQFADVEIFKPHKTHSIRSSFYLVAKNVQPGSTAAGLALRRYKNLWKQTTLLEPIHGDGVTADENALMAVIDDFGDTLRDLGREVWRIQKDALEKAPFISGDKDPAELRRNNEWTLVVSRGRAFRICTPRDVDLPQSPKVFP
ncbi:hypothetical protein FN846DRAFT_1004817 [Sphaerosporella brunnea]|uniref:Ribosomal RNA methyltransferase FtsJ domain-containing protein n=1 Tax=Sphaerosporella brunnea TaxID=1250544 RepID=A0A5J5F2U9_9PEZI|nr:hypothetical protein FN846DRAFT_1004817 [Sphaerosporella brunnea]